MSKDNDVSRGGGTNSRPLNDTIAQTGRGIPDEAIGPGELSPADEAGLADDAQANAMAKKLEREANQWQAEGDHAADDNARKPDPGRD
jgi:hypothetical protein